MPVEYDAGGRRQRHLLLSEYSGTGQPVLLLPIGIGADDDQRCDVLLPTERSGPLLLYALSITASAEPPPPPPSSPASHRCRSWSPPLRSCRSPLARSRLLRPRSRGIRASSWRGGTRRW